MGTLGQYLRNAREARGIALRDAAQQTRIRFNYLKALEEEDFARLPGEVFVKGFLKNYGKFLHLEEFEVMKKYAESRSQDLIEHPDTVEDKAPAPAVGEQKTWKLTRYRAVPLGSRDRDRSHSLCVHGPARAA